MQGPVEFSVLEASGLFRPEHKRPARAERCRRTAGAAYPLSKEGSILAVEGSFPAMPYCPNCLTEYVEGTTTCEDCGAQLAPGSPPEAPRTQSAGFGDSKLVTVRVFSGPTALLDADVARNILQTQGLPSIVPGETSAELLPVLDVSLLVREEDAERAARILQEYLDSEPASPPE